MAERASLTTTVAAVQAPRPAGDGYVKALVLVLAALASGPVSGADEIHRWVDQHGQVHFGDRPPAGSAAEIVEVRPNVYESPAFDSVAAELDSGEAVVLYSAEWCGHCKRARRYFRRRGIPFTEYDVETSAKGRRDYQRMQARGVPIILVGRRRLNGFDEAAFEQLHGG